MSTRAVRAARWSAGGAWQALGRAYARLEATERGYVWLNKLGPAYIFGLVAAFKLYALYGSLGVLGRGEGSLERALLAAYEASSGAFFGLVALLFVLRKRPLRKAANPIQGIVALLGSFIMLPVALSPGLSDEAAVLLAADLLTIAGTAGAALALAALGRCFGIFPEARGLVTHGAYRFARHPMYLFEFVAFLGVLLPALTVQHALLYILFAAFQLARMQFEEETLSAAFPAEYPAYRRRTARLIPGVY